jgi:Triose-phosphate Transporter family
VVFQPLYSPPLSHTSSTTLPSFPHSLVRAHSRTPVHAFTLGSPLVLRLWTRLLWNFTSSWVSPRYFSSSLSNNLNKQILRDFHHPMTLTMLQFLFLGVFCLLVLRVFKLHPFQMISKKKFIQLVMPLGIGHIVGHLLTAISLDHVPVSFVHTIKVMPDRCSAGVNRSAMNARLRE